LLLLIESDAISVTNPRSTENIKGTADCQMDSSGTDLLDTVEIFERFCSARVGGWQWTSLGQNADKFFIDTPTKAFDIGGMNEEFGTKLGKMLAGSRINRNVGKSLPAIGHDPEAIVASTATKIQDETFPTDTSDKFFKAVKVESGILKKPRGDNDLCGTGFEPIFGVVGSDPTPILETSGPSGKGIERGSFIAGAKSDDVTAG
jgi:hypothetical protein